MSGKVIVPGNIQGLSLQEIPVLRKQYGKNIFHAERQRRYITIVWDILK